MTISLIGESWLIEMTLDRHYSSDNYHFVTVAHGDRCQCVFIHKTRYGKYCYIDI